MDKVFIALSLSMSSSLALSYGANDLPGQKAVYAFASDENGTSAEFEQGQGRTLPRQTSEAEFPAKRRPGAFLGFSWAAVSDIGETNQYKVLYGDEKKELGFFAGYYLWTYLFDFGLAGKFGYYRASGHPVTGIDRNSLPIKGDLPASITADPSQSMELSLLPIQVLGNIALSPFASRRVVLRAWFGPEFLYVQESIKPDLPSTVSGGSDSSFVNKGWNQGFVYGAMLSIGITGLEARSDYAMRSIGIDRTYISPFLEVIKTNDDKMGNFDRKNYGIAFNFESLR